MLVEQCPPLLSRFGHSQTLVDGVLQLFVELSDHLAVFVDQEVDVARLYACLMQLLRVYADNQLIKYTNNAAAGGDIDDKACDLQLVMQMIGNILSRDIIVQTMINGSCCCNVCLLLLELNSDKNHSEKVYSASLSLLNL